MGLDDMTQDKASRGWLTILLIISLVTVLLATAVLFLLVVNKFSVEIQMNGDPAVTLEYGETYEEYGAAAVLRGSMAFTDGIELEVKTQGQVPRLQLGEYTVTYSASFGPWSSSAVRTVDVVDTQPPIITLFTNDAVFTRPGQPYREEGYLAVDNYDGDITDFVEVTEDAGSVVYRVSDSSGNTATVIRRIRYSDPE